MLAKVFLINVPPAFTIAKMKGWLQRFSIDSICSISSHEGTCIQIETNALPEANKIACVLESIYIGNGPLNVVRGDTEEGHGVLHFFPGGALTREGP